MVSRCGRDCRAAGGTFRAVCGRVRSSSFHPPASATSSVGYERGPAVKPSCHPNRRTPPCSPDPQGLTKDDQPTRRRPSLEHHPTLTGNVDRDHPCDLTTPERRCSRRSRVELQRPDPHGCILVRHDPKRARPEQSSGTKKTRPPRTFSRSKRVSCRPAVCGSGGARVR